MCGKKKKGEIMDQLQIAEERIEKLEKDRIRNNLLSGVKLSSDREEVLKEIMEDMVKKS